MDILSWTKLNPNIRIANVNRRFYNQYYYKLEVSVTGSGFLRHPDLTIEAQADKRKYYNDNRTINFGGSWRYNRSADPVDQDIKILNKIKTAQQNYSNLRFRVEEPMFQVYSDNVLELHQFATEIAHLDNQHLVAIHAPATEQRLELLKQGYTISRKPADFPIKVHVREGRYNLQTKRQVINYLNNMPDEAYLPKHFVDSFSKDYESVWNCYFYIKDRSILTMLALISPLLIRTTEEYHLSPEDK
jgi:hypothetical protein